jgi:hypothetical protein
VARTPRSFLTTIGTRSVIVARRADCTAGHHAFD